MRTVGLLLRAQLRGRRPYPPPEPPRSPLFSGTYDLRTGGFSSLSRGGGQAVDRTVGACLLEFWGPVFARNFDNPGVFLGHGSRRGNFSEGVKRANLSKVHDDAGHTQIFCRGFSNGGFYSAFISRRRNNPREWITYDPQAFAEYYRYRPFKVAHRAVILISEVVLLSIGQVLVKDIKTRAERLKTTLIRLGAFYVKLGQALSTRPDILPSDYCQELAKLQDHVPAYPTPIALEFLESELGLPASELYAYFTTEPVAAASLGQVYKARLHSGEMVAVKVQRPGVTGRLALDAYLLCLLGGPLQKFAGARSDVIAMLSEIVERMFEEVDYVREGQYAERFGRLYGTTEDNVSEARVWHGLERLRVKTVSDGSMEGMVKVPKVYWDLTSRGVLTMEWVDGLKLTDKEALRSANLDTRSLVDQGVFCSLRQLLEEGFFHADPHPGNLVVTKEGVLAYFDFGMMSEISKEHRIGLIRTIIHFVNRDSSGLAEDFKALGFISTDTETKPIAEALHRTFAVEGTKSRLDFQGIMAQLSDVMYQFKFRLPPEYAMVIRALGSLEGTATTLDPGFKVVASAYPFIIGRLLADPDPAMREILRELLIRSNGSIRWHRLERLVFAIAEQSTSASRDENQAEARASWRGRDGLGQRAASGIRGAFNTRAVASATMDVLHFILSEKGVRIRTLLVQDITQVFDHFLEQSIGDVLNLKKSIRTTTVGQNSQGLQSGAATHNDSIHPQDTPPKEPEEPLSWSHYTSANYWGWVAGRKVLGKDFAGQNTEIEKGTHFGAQVIDVSSSDAPGVEDYTGRFKVGFQAFANAVNSSPEIWIPLLARLGCNPEARSLAGAITASLFYVDCGRTSEASFLVISRALHSYDASKFQGQVKQDYPSENKL